MGYDGRTQRPGTVCEAFSRMPKTRRQRRCGVYVPPATHPHSLLGTERLGRTKGREDCVYVSRAEDRDSAEPAEQLGPIGHSV